MGNQINNCCNPLLKRGSEALDAAEYLVMPQETQRDTGVLFHVGSMKDNINLVNHAKLQLRYERCKRDHNIKEHEDFVGPTSYQTLPGVDESLYKGYCLFLNYRELP